MDKICSRCSLTKKIEEFGKRKDSKDGYHGVCKICRNGDTKKWRKSEKYVDKIYTDDEIRSEKERKRKYYLDNKEDILRRSKEYRENNVDYVRGYKKKYYENNRDKLISYSTNYHLKRIKNDDLYKFRYNIKVLIKNSIKYRGYKKKTKTTNILGCSLEYFRKYIESKFETWMNWDNYGKYNGEFNYGWDIDHIIPISSAKNEEDIIKLSHYTNLQPLCSRVNRTIKKNK